MFELVRVRYMILNFKIFAITMRLDVRIEPLNIFMHKLFRILLFY